MLSKCYLVKSQQLCLINLKASVERKLVADKLPASTKCYVASTSVFLNNAITSATIIVAELSVNSRLDNF